MTPEDINALWLFAGVVVGFVLAMLPTSKY